MGGGLRSVAVQSVFSDSAFLQTLRAYAGTQQPPPSQALAQPLRNDRVVPDMSREVRVAQALPGIMPIEVSTVSQFADFDSVVTDTVFFAS